ncbi:TetR/AcrR family transcriptional regulator [Mesorhizobium microcysteis]|uniref:TetR/AcrR family transcriptional regulator n=1 Tax=Neoaquamicrobium microcysteis TaxID=2682781 RepID=A0A5D4H8I4_9HYPH|nr:TetR/AcrR family transcriptional regulator [Mesorhizobium microcysteis]TYR37156.1 TetR/AcrR family transcriptional regulator [Mesorhizobium microcysteis]
MNNTFIKSEFPMSPRRYQMKSRTASIAATRQRIVEATVELHGQKGIFGTSWQEIAREADVAVGTVYKHFPSLDELVPACGELLMERIRPPSPDDADAIIGDASDVGVRLRRVVRALFDFYKRGGTHLENDPRERELPAVREWEVFMRGMIEHFARQALIEHRPSDQDLQLIGALLDFRTYKAMSDRAIPHADAIEDVVMLIIGRINAQGRTD